MGIFYPPGRYRLRITSAALGEAKARDDGTPGNPQIEVGIEIVGDYRDNEFNPLTGPPRTVFFALTEATVGTAPSPGWVMQTLADLGFRGPSFADLQPLVGKERDGECKHDDYTGEAKEKWSIYRATRAPIKPVDSKGVRGLDARFKDVLKVVAQKTAGGVLPGAAKPAAKPAQAPASTRLPDKTAADFAPPEEDRMPSTFPGRGEEEIPF